ncbi:uncharacterized protein LOC126799222 isoform X2 [Argentina anserina]|uniref:uncharacterized protein LOC126799222 isoform X2 n=1 Tax=Argentina anserina TaxID=57926 RepID=UPI0021765B5D|nr:uncharacterized protein LOC126799222 isoform X2 [Potentilla anserina]
MASHLSQLHIFHQSRSVRPENRQSSTSNLYQPTRSSTKKQGTYGFPKKSLLCSLFYTCYPSSWWSSSRILSSIVCKAYSGEAKIENGAAVAEIHDREVEFNRVNCLVWVLHESARSFSLAIESLELTGSSSGVAMAWSGKDIHAWHRRLSYQVALYALLKTAIEVETLLSSQRHYSDSSPVSDILTGNINLVGEHIERQLNMRHSELVEWFRVVEFPRIAGFFIPLLRQWSMEYAGSGVAGIVVAISCCAAVAKLGPERVNCSLFAFSVKDVMVELMDLSHSLVSVERLHPLAIEAGFELDFLSHFGRKVLLSSKGEEVEFWIGLAYGKLSSAFHNECTIPGKQKLLDKVQADTLATLGLFAYLGRKTRLFLSTMGINNTDELLKDFLSYLECGSIFIYPEFSSITVYQHFMEVVTDEIGWLDFYAACPPKTIQERRKTKLHAIQAEKEIALSAVFTVCYDVYSGFAHFSRATQLSLDKGLLEFLLQSQSLLTVCLEDYWSAYDKSSDWSKITDTGRLSTKAPYLPGNESITSLEEGSARKQRHLHRILIKKYSDHLVAASSDVWMGTHLLVIDLMNAFELLLKQLRGHKVSRRERNKLQRTLNDITSLIPVTILMLLPVSAAGHALMFTAINKYIPDLIPSPYTAERLDVVKQLTRTKKMEVRTRNNLEHPPSRIK